MNDSNELERLLKSAPRPHAPAHLLARLQTDIDLPEASPETARAERRVGLWKMIPIFSIAAAAAVVAVSLVLFLPASTAYSFQETVNSLREVSAMHVLHRFRSGPSQPLPESAIGEGTTTFHPANPFAEAETMTASIKGRELSFTRGSSGIALIRNGPLGLRVNTKTNERQFFLDASENLAGRDPAEWLLEMEEDARMGKIQFEIPDRPDADGNLKIVIRHPLLDEDEWFLLWVDAETNLPVLTQHISSAFREYGDQVVLAEWKFLKFGDIDPAIFEIEPTDAELEHLGLQREDLQDLPLSATSIEISGEAGLPVIGTISDDRGSREISGTLPMILVEAPKGRMTIDLHAKDEKRHTLEATVGGLQLAGTGPRIVISLSENGTEKGISVPPLDYEL